MPCALCDKPMLSTVSTVDAKSHKPLHVAICNGCGLVQQDPIPSEEELHHFYSHHYTEDYKGIYVPKPKHVYRAGMTALARVRFLQENGIADGTMLDIGAGGGEFVYLARAQGYDAVGVEPNIGYAEYAKSQYGVNIAADLSRITGKYDIISMFHVLEHVPNFEIFKKLWLLLNEGGHLFIEVPDIEANDASPHNIFFKAHIFYFSLATLTACASPYFERLRADDRSNLRVLFRRKRHVSRVTWPTQMNVAYTVQRLSEKGWFEYLITGGGLFKGLSKLRQVLREAKIKHKKGLQILDALLTEAPTPWRLPTYAQRKREKVAQTS
jgi:2-polyprenyl-3-methyl-5-hydroxy-6-metoxy-1,4-benzoquinol methylase